MKVSSKTELPAGKVNLGILKGIVMKANGSIIRQKELESTREPQEGIIREAGKKINPRAMASSIGGMVIFTKETLKMG